MRYRLGAFMGLAASLWIAAAAEAQVINHPTGFTGQTDMSLNGTATVSGSNIRLTTTLGNQIGYLFSTAQLPVDRFVARFDFHTLGTAGSLADGMGFCAQRVGPTPTPIGGGGGMGYAGMLTSFFVKFDNWQNVSTTQIYTNGTAPADAGSLDMRAAGVDLHSMHDFRVLMNYNGSVIAMTVTDLTSNAVFTTNFTINVPAVIGGSTAHVGFTAATGGAFANQDVLNFVYVTAPTNVTGTNGTNQVVLNWNAVTGATNYNVYRGTVNGGPYPTQVGTGVAGTTFTDNTAAWPNTYFYVVRAVVGTLEGPNSLQVTGTPVPPAITATPNTGLQTNENGGTAVFNITLNQALTAGNSITFAVQSQDATEGGVSGGGQPFATTISFMVNGPQAAGFQIPITVTGLDDPMVDPGTAYQVSVSATSTQAAFNGITIPNIQLVNVDNDTPGISVSRTSGLVTSEGGAADTFTVSLTTQPSAPVTMTLTSSNPGEGSVSPGSITFNTTAGGANGWNVAQVVTVTGQDDAALDFAIAYTIFTGDLSSGDGNYNTMPVPDVSVLNFDNEAIPALPSVWGGGSGGGCGLTGLEVLLLAGLAALRRARMR